MNLRPYIYSNRTHLIPLGIICSFLLIFLIAIHGRVVYQPNGTILSEKGEGARVIFTLNYHAKNDSSFTHFEGMNAPFGEHIVYCDAQPIVTNSFRLLSKIFPGLENHAVGFQNTLSFLSFFLGAILLYIFLIRSKVDRISSSLISIALICLGPQISRMPWQPGLAYAFEIPLILVMCQSILRGLTWKKTVLYSSFTLILYLINPYIGFMANLAFLIVALYAWKDFKKHLLPYFFLLFSAGLIYFTWIYLTDTHTDRVDVPIGFDDFRAEFNTVFASINSPFSSFYLNLGLDKQDNYMHGEGWAYVGVIVSLLAIFLSINFIIKSWYRENMKLNFLLPVALVFLFFSMGWPFSLHPSLEGFMDYFSPLRQFKAPGRFAWVFYYSLGLICFIGIYNFLSRKSVKGKLLIIIIAILSTIQIFEGSYLHYSIVHQQYHQNPFDARQLPKSDYAYLKGGINYLKKEKYDLILPLPYLHVGSELFVAPSKPNAHSFLESTVLSYHSSVPLMSAHLSRISKKESIKSLQIFSKPFIEKEILKDLKGKKIALLLSKKTPGLNSNEKRIWEASKPILEDANYELRELDFKVLNKQNGNRLLTEFQHYKASYTSTKKGEYIAPMSKYYFLHKNSKHKGYIGNSIRLKPKSKVIIPNKNLNKGMYLLEYWLKCTKNSSQSHLILNGETRYDSRQSFDFDKGWMFVSIPVKIENEDLEIQFDLPSNLSEIFIDELCLRPEEKSSLFYHENGRWTWNGIALK